MRRLSKLLVVVVHLTLMALVTGEHLTLVRLLVSELALPLLDGRAAPRAVAERDDVDVAARRPHGPGLGGRLDDEPHGVARRAGAAQGVAQIALVLAPRVAQRAAVGDEQEPALAGRRLRENYDQHRDGAPAPRGSHHRMPIEVTMPAFCHKDGHGGGEVLASMILALRRRNLTS